MSKVIYVCLAFLLLTLAITPAPAQTLINGCESVAFDSLRNRYLASSLWNGEVIAIDTLGNQTVYLTGYGNMYGNCINGDTLFFSTGATIFGIEMATNDTILQILMPQGVRSYDGMTTDTSGNLWVVYTGGAIYKIDIATQVYTNFISAGLAVWTQDIIFDARNDRLLVVGYSANAPIQAIDINSGSLTNLVNTPGYCDGITIDHAGNVYISSHVGGGRTYRYDRHFVKPAELISTGHDEPAGLDFNWRDHVLAVPNFAGNSVDFIPLTFGPVLEEWSFDDSIGGDGDGAPEAGETVELQMAVVNYGKTAATDVSVILDCEDDRITFSNDYVFLGDIDPQQGADNAADPFAFSIPADYIPRIDEFYIIVTYNAGSGIDTTVINQVIGAPRILLIDDDNSDNIETFYTESLTEAKIPVDIWSMPPAPTYGDLSSYEIVIWFTGDYRLPYDSDAISAITDYLDNGGNLFLSGQGIAHSLDSQDPDFLHNYLKAEYVSSQLVPVLAAEIPGVVFGDSDSLYVAGSGGAANQTSPDHLTAVNGGVGEFLYATTDHTAAVSYNGTYKLVFFGFGFEAVVNGYERWTDRYELMDDILNFFGYQRPDAPPDVSAPALVIEDPTHVLNHIPELTWSYFSPASNPQSACHIQVSEFSDWVSAEMWDSGPLANTTQQESYAGNELQDGVTYYIRVRVSDGSLWSDWAEMSLHMNSIPHPTSLTPDNLQEVPDNELMLTHDNPPDTEGDSVWYTYEIYDDVALASLVATAADMMAGVEATSSWTPSVSLEFDNDYFWRVRGRDQLENGPWSETASFVYIRSFIPGDANGDDVVNVGDAVFIINYIFKGGAAPDPLEAADANCDTVVNVGDAVHIINYIFKGGPAPGCP